MPVLPVDPHLFSTFLGIMAVMAITPGPANLFAVASGVQRGRASALVSVAGMNSASLVWFGAAALGLGALVAAFPAVFRLIDPKATTAPGCGDGPCAFPQDAGKTTGGYAPPPNYRN